MAQSKVRSVVGESENVGDIFDSCVVQVGVLTFLRLIKTGLNCHGNEEGPSEKWVLGT
jgi:hypothetical protein